MSTKSEPAASSDSAVNYKIIFVLTLVHFTGDFYSSFFSPLLPAFVDKLGLTLAQVGFITGMVRFLSFIIQPAVGYMADRYESRWFPLTGLLLTFFVIPFSGIAPNYWILMLILCVGSIGSSMFHPSVTGMIPLYSGNRTGLCLSIFNTGGTFSFAIGPVFITWFVGMYGLSNMPITAVIGLVAFVVCLKYLPKPVSENMSKHGFIGSLKENMGSVYKSIILIWLVMVLRAVAGQAYMTYMPIHLTDHGHSLSSLGFIVAIFTLAGTLSGLLCGYLADRIGYKKVFLLSHIFMAPALLFYLYFTGPLVYLSAFVAGFFILAPMPLGVGLAQKLVPKSRAMVSSLMMGFAYGLGGAISPLVGKLCDIYGIEQVMHYAALVPLVSLIFIMKFPEPD